VFEADFVGAPRGRRAIREFIERIIPAPGEGPRRKHLMSNIEVALDGDRARVQSIFLLVTEAPHGIAIAAAGRYVDDVRREDGRWLFARRRLHIDFHAGLGLRHEADTRA
jgi:ketosteroid isomerase-like protein